MINLNDAYALKEKQRALREGFSNDLGLRVHRSISWLIRSAAEQDDPDAAFVFLWIAFNSAYSQDIGIAYHVAEKGRFKSFLNTLLSFDSNDRIYDIVWTLFPKEIHLILENQYVFGAFWNHQNRVEGYSDWEEQLKNSVQRAKIAMANKETERVLNELFDRLYVLRNQIIHGGATWAGETNRAQVNDGAEILGSLIPVFIDLMMEHPQYVWNSAIYPVIALD
ncbi:HEPN domain-containing protein [Litorivicinus sp.]|nr:HEPN domain-containing protein [Litorivicinus sp.]MDC1208616.1 HEPN domain-containing protein [Litorivicinus sp.]